MTPTELPSGESERLRILREYAILDTPPEDCFDRITAIAARYFDVPISLVSLVDEDRNWYKSKRGMDLNNVDRESAICTHAILDDDILFIADASQDPRFSESSVVTGSPNVRFYAGAQLVSPTGSRIGALCLLDTTVSVYLTEEMNAQIANIEPRMSSAPVVGGLETILIVEDNPGVREVAVSILSELGYRIVEAESGADALAMLRQHYDTALMFTAIIMPGEMNGADLAVRAALDARAATKTAIKSAMPA